MKIVTIISVIVLAMLSSCNDHNKDKGNSVNKEIVKTKDETVQLSTEQSKNAGIEIGLPEKKDMHKVLKVSGTIDVPPQSVVSVSMPLGGYLRNTGLMPGMKVHKGEILATMEDQQYIQLQQDYLITKSKLAYYEAENSRQKKLNEAKAASDKIYQLAQSDYESQKVLLKSFGEKLKLIGINPEKLDENTISKSVNIYCPINGFVTKVNVNIGKYINPSDIMFELVNPVDLHLHLTVFENDAANLVIGQKVICYSNNQPQNKYEAKIKLINPSIGKERTTEVHCHLVNYGKELLPGMYMNGEIELENANVNTLPEEAVVKWNNAAYIFYEIEVNKYRVQEVETGISNNGYVEIKSTIPKGKIVTKNAYTLLSKMKNSGEEG